MSAAKINIIQRLFLGELADPAYLDASLIPQVPYHLLLITIPVFAAVRYFTQKGMTRFFERLPRMNQVLKGAGPNARAARIAKATESFFFGSLYTITTAITVALTLLNDIPYGRDYGLAGLFAPGGLHNPAEDIRPLWLWHSYVLIQISHYVSAMGFQIYETRAQNADSAMMVFHHVATLLLMLGSIAVGWNRCFLAVVMLHDSCDILLEFAKVCNYLEYKVAANIMFYVFMAIWFVQRNFIYTFKFVFSSTGYVASKTNELCSGFPTEETGQIFAELRTAALEAGRKVHKVPGIPAYGLFKACLFGLVGCNYVWGFFIIRLAWRFSRDWRNIQDNRELDWAERATAADNELAADAPTAADPAIN